MKILHLSSSDITGGAARAAYRLHEGLCRIGEDSKMLVLRKKSRDPSVQKYEPPVRWSSRLARRFRRYRFGTQQSFRPLGERSLEVFSTDRSDLGADILEQVGTPDVINLHWVSGMFDFTAFFERLPGGIPVVWTLHDMNPFTGGCHFDGGCGRFAQSCGKCPQLESNREQDLSSQIWSRKHAALQKLSPDRLAIVAPSRWLTNQCRKSSVLGRFPVECIPYGLDTEVFKPRNRQAIREVLGIPQDAKVVLFVAGSLKNPRKGFDLLEEALAVVRREQPIWLLSIGRGEGGCDVAKNHRCVEHTDDDRFLSFIYSAADLFVIPSREDNLPNTVMESIACGTPVVGFDVGGIPDMVRATETGVLAVKGDAAQLGGMIAGLLGDESARSRMALRCREVAISEYALEVQAGRYAASYACAVNQMTCSNSKSCHPTADARPGLAASPSVSVLSGNAK